MTPRAQYLTVPLLLLLAWGSFLLPTAHADVIYSQDNYSNATAKPITGRLAQQLGTGLTGSVSSISYTIYSPTATSSQLYFWFMECSNNATSHSDCTGRVDIKQSYELGTAISCQSISAGDTATTTQVQYDLKSSKYYLIEFQNTVCEHTGMGIDGTASNLYTNGACSGTSGATCGTALDLGFSINGTQTFENTSSAYNLSPTVGSTTQNTYVNFTFDYNASAADSITSYKIFIKDNQSASPILADTIITGSIGTGIGSISRYATLKTGHGYTWWVEICGTYCHTGGGNPTFSVVTPFYLNPNWSNIAATSTSGSPFLGISTSSLSAVTELQCGVLDILSGTCFSSVMSYLLIPSPYVVGQFGGLGDLLGTKVPFSYITDINTAFGNIELNATSSMPLISIPLSTIASSTITGVMPDMEISTTTISEYFTDEFRLPLQYLLIAAIWLSVGWVFFGDAMRIIK